VTGDALGGFELTAVLQERRDPRRTEAVVRKQRREPRAFQPSLHHLQRLVSRHRFLAQTVVRLAGESGEEGIGSFDAAGLGPLIEIFRKGWMAGDPENPSVWVVNAKLKIGGFLVREFNDDPDPGGPMSMNLGAVFDSTHFLHGTNLAITYEVTDNWGRVYSKTKSAPVKNRALLYEHPDGAGYPSGVSAVAAWLAGENYEVLTRFGSTWSKASVEADMSNMSLSDFNTHGAPSAITAGDNSTFGYLDILNTRTAVNGSGNPPFNSTGNPTTQFGAIDACNVGDTGNFLTWFFPYLTGYGKVMPNQGLWTWSGYCSFGDSSEIVNELWNNLTDGYTIGYSQIQFVQKCILRSGETPPYIRWSPDDITYRSVLFLGDVPIYGDSTMRIKSVYTGTHSAPAGWYR
jgi:hypothetical protein